MSGHAQVCLQDLQVPREIFPVFLTKGRLIYILYSRQRITRISIQSIDIYFPCGPKKIYLLRGDISF